MSLETPIIKKSHAEQLLILHDKLRFCGLTEETLSTYQDLINKVNFKDIDLSSEAGTIHVDMLATLMIEQENGEIFFQNILEAINQDLQSVDNILIISANEIEAESIDLDIGTNRRVDRFRCSFDHGDDYEFTLSADLDNHQNDEDSNSFVEKEVFADPVGINNPWLQKYFSYIKKNIGGRAKRLIAKEYLPGKNIVQYFNEGANGEVGVADFIDVASETAYTIGGLYKRMSGQLLGDLKLENIIYNYENPDSSPPACRICDHSGYHSDKADERSALQVLAHLNSFMTLYYSQTKINDPEVAQQDVATIVDTYLEAFAGEIDEVLLDKFLADVTELRKSPADIRQWELSDDILDYVINYEY